MSDLLNELFNAKTVFLLFIDEYDSDDVIGETNEVNNKQLYRLKRKTCSSEIYRASSGDDITQDPKSQSVSSPVKSKDNISVHI